jgi:hypothetical protein
MQKHEKIEKAKALGMTRGRRVFSVGLGFEGPQISKARPGAPFDFTLTILQRAQAAVRRSVMTRKQTVLALAGFMAQAALKVAGQQKRQTTTW